jgi:hypothetical protein
MKRNNNAVPRLKARNVYRRSVYILVQARPLSTQIIINDAHQVTNVEMFNLRVSGPLSLFRALVMRSMAMTTIYCEK